LPIQLYSANSIDKYLTQIAGHMARKKTMIRLIAGDWAVVYLGN